MKSKQLCPKSVRPVAPLNLSARTPRARVRCSLCNGLLKGSTTHRYLLIGKSVQEKIPNSSITYAECCQRYLHGTYEQNKLQMICPKCSLDLQRVYSLHRDAHELLEKIRQTCRKTKRLNQPRPFRTLIPRLVENSTSSSPLSSTVTDDNMPISIKEEFDYDDETIETKTNGDQTIVSVSETVTTNMPFDLSKSHSCSDDVCSMLKSKSTRTTTLKQSNQSLNQPVLNPIPVPTTKSNANHFLSTLSSSANTTAAATATDINGSSRTDFFKTHTFQSASSVPFVQLLVNPKTAGEQSRRSSTTSETNPSALSFEPPMDDDRSYSPPIHDHESPSIGEGKAARLSRRQYTFLEKLTDQNALNAFIESSSAESGSRWTWRRTSANSRGYKVYYVCNFSMRRHYHPCPAAMYALFHPEGAISIYSCGQHQHIPKDRLPVSITDETKDEIFKCLQNGMSTTEIREHLTRLQLPFGDTRKLNNFIKYHKELLKFGTVTNVRIGGTAYRQPQCWAIRRQAALAAAASASAAKTNDNETN